MYMRMCSTAPENGKMYAEHKDYKYLRGGRPIRWGRSARSPRLMEWTQPGQNTKCKRQTKSKVAMYGHVCVCVCECVCVCVRMRACVCVCMCSENEIMFRGM